jgi:hypothetical protein
MNFVKKNKLFNQSKTKEHTAIWASWNLVELSYFRLPKTLVCKI